MNNVRYLPFHLAFDGSLGEDEKRLLHSGEANLKGTDFEKFVREEARLEMDRVLRGIRERVDA